MIPDPLEHPTLSTKEAAKVFGCSDRTLYELARQDKAPVEPLRLGRKLRWPTARVLAVLGLGHDDQQPSV